MLLATCAARKQERMRAGAESQRMSCNTHSVLACRDRMLAQKREMQSAAEHSSASSPDSDAEHDTKPASGRATKRQVREPGQVLTRRASLLAKIEPESAAAQESVQLVSLELCHCIFFCAVVFFPGYVNALLTLLCLVSFQVEVDKGSPETMPEAEKDADQDGLVSHESSEASSEVENSAEGDETDSNMTVEAEHYVWDEAGSNGNGSIRTSQWYPKAQSCGTFSG